ncbi:MAG: hypothetical protein LBP33_01025 [Candidatus Adiutrix sp.]|nr:hypothetical protein [Candidatus Adiutrix sp.]
MKRFFHGLFSAVFLTVTVLAAGGCAEWSGFGRQEESRRSPSRPARPQPKAQAAAQPVKAATPGRPTVVAHSYIPSWPGDDPGQRPAPRRQESETPVRPDRPAQPEWTGSTGRETPAAEPAPAEDQPSLSGTLEIAPRTVAAVPAPRPAPAPATRPAVRTNLSTPPLPPNVAPLKPPEPAAENSATPE